MEKAQEKENVLRFEESALQWDLKPLIFLTEQKGNKLFDNVNFTGENPQYLRAFQPTGKESTGICVCNQNLNIKTTN